MKIEEAVKAHAASEVASVGGRVHSAPLPQDKPLPSVTYQRIDTVVEPTHDEPGVSDYQLARFQLDVWADSSAARTATADEVEDAFSGFQGQMGGAEGVSVGHSRMITRFQLSDPETKVRREVLEFSIQYLR